MDRPVGIAHYARVVRQQWILIVASALLGAGIATAYCVVATPSYSATSKAFVSVGSASTVSDLSQGGTFTQNVAQSYGDVATSSFVLNPVIRQLGLHETASTLAKQVQIDVPVDTVVISMTVTTSSPTRAAQIANAISTSLATAVKTLSPSGQSATTLVKVTTVQEATVPVVPSSPNVPVYILVGLLAGTLVAIVAASIADAADTRVRTVAQLRGLTQTALLGSIPFVPQKSRNTTRFVSGSQAMEAVRTVRTNLQFVHSSAGSRVVLITSSLLGEGKTTTAINLAIALHEAGRRVVLVDCDLRRPAVASSLGLEGSVGLSSLLIGSSTLGESIQNWGEESMPILPAGTLAPNPSELLQDQKMAEIIRDLRSEYEYVLLDAPPVLPVADATILSANADAVVLLGAIKRVRKTEVVEAIRRLEQVDAHVLGLIASMTPSSGDESYERYGYYEASPSS